MISAVPLGRIRFRFGNPQFKLRAIVRSAVGAKLLPQCDSEADWRELGRSQELVNSY
jgi:hypothetical protein